MKYMTPQWYMMCQGLHPSAENERSIREAMEAYRREYVKNFGRKEPDFGNAHLHDSIVLSQRQEGGDLVMELEPDMTDITRLVFKGFSTWTLSSAERNREAPPKERQLSENQSR